MADITCEELKQRLDNGEKINLVDVREPFEHEAFSIGGKLIPLGILPYKLDELNELQDEEVVIYCRSGNRSGHAKNFLMQNNFSNVRNLLGGMIEWQNLNSD
ncbi:MAG: rhodanese-like domain-containing protein [Bacteroidia bacterium]